jgi:hypothetical protein
MKEKARSDPGFFFAVIGYDAQTKREGVGSTFPLR